MRFDKPRIRHETVCEYCGEKTTVPFEPTEDRKVYCRDCWPIFKPDLTPR